VIPRHVCKAMYFAFALFLLLSKTYAFENASSTVHVNQEKTVKNNTSIVDELFNYTPVNWQVSYNLICDTHLTIEDVGSDVLSHDSVGFTIQTMGFSIPPHLNTNPYHKIMSTLTLEF
jgi:hypothetical protein